MGETGEGVWINTPSAVERVRHNRRCYEEPTAENRNGSWQGRRIIGRDTPINGGVYLGGSAREAIVVDDAKQPELRRAYEDFLRRNRGDWGGERFLNRAFDVAREKLPFDEAKVDRLTALFTADEKISLGSFIVNRCGVCRHEALLGAYLIEKAIKDGYIGGRVSIDRNHISGKGGHAWVRYDDPRGRVFIVDAAMGFVGRIEQAGRDWSYERPRQAVMGRRR